MKTIRLSAFAISILIALTASLPASVNDDEDDDVENEITIEKLTLVKDTGKDFQPVKSFKPTDTFGVLVQLSEALEGTEVKGVWTAVDAGELHDKKILEKNVEFTPEEIENAKNPSRVDFTLSHDDPYPAGNYKFDVYLNGKLADTLKFTIEE
jgi:hypothetical protein